MSEKSDMRGVRYAPAAPMTYALNASQVTRCNQVQQFARCHVLSGGTRTPLTSAVKIAMCFVSIVQVPWSLNVLTVKAGTSYSLQMMTLLVLQADQLGTGKIMLKESV